MKTSRYTPCALARSATLAFTVLSLVSGCVPDVDDDESVVVAPRLIAVTAQPAEVAPGETVTWTAWIASPDGTLETATAPVWSQCLVRPSLAEAGSVSQRCLRGEEGTFIALGQGTVVQGIVPADACARFGPDPPPVEPGQPAGSPASPDVTGGYRQPLILRGDASWSYDQLILEQRIRCNLAGATPEESVRFRQQYRNNTNPRLTTLQVLDDDGNTLG
ncbi:MAG: hypothetical protein KGO50_15515, partial [Myxococcales bacterium]|nr:hypothetical protein [Myxococcales bacterium]